MVEPVVARCAVCGTQYTARAWPWLESVGAVRDERRVCAVPGCCATLQRGNVARGCGCVAANDDRRRA